MSQNVPRSSMTNYFDCKNLSKYIFFYSFFKYFQLKFALLLYILCVWTLKMAPSDKNRLMMSHTFWSFSSKLGEVGLDKKKWKQIQRRPFFLFCFQFSLSAHICQTCTAYWPKPPSWGSWNKLSFYHQFSFIWLVYCSQFVSPLSLMRPNLYILVWSGPLGARNHVHGQWSWQNHNAACTICIRINS